MSADPMGTIIAELVAANVASGRVRGNEPRGRSTNYEGDALGPGSYKRFVVVVDLGGPPIVRTAAQGLRYAVRAYGATYQDARALYGEVQDVLHLAGNRIGVAEIPIYQSLDDTGGSAHKDPDTGQPYYDGVFGLIAGTMALAGS
jgi:hypothetical protein